ncbi:hypothetical protein [Rhizobium sp. BK602]|uniref:hypothetical protein n=1 Tax=Rhizobium sp. BK602 TaxID=2586986 RepID=UPI001620E7E6|nr:hypothetical protein [Rhizobium sp. BK602]MBB3612599.1 hypothetical protein [Rhizobium sp. BK602]
MDRRSLLRLFSGAIVERVGISRTNGRSSFEDAGTSTDAHRTASYLEATGLPINVGSGLISKSSTRGNLIVELDEASLSSLALANGASQRTDNLADIPDLGAAQNNLQIEASFADVSTAISAAIPARSRRISIQFYDLRTMSRNAAAKYRRISLADITDFPKLSFFRSNDRFMPDGSTDNTNGGYWLIDVPLLRPEMLGAQINVAAFDSGPALQATIDVGSLLGVAVQLPIGTIYTSQTINIYTQSVLSGYGKSQSFIKLQNGAGIANDRKAILQTKGFFGLVDSTVKLITDPKITWGFSITGITIDGNRQNNYGGSSGTRFAGVGTDKWDGGGIRLYGRRYVIQDVGIQYCAGIGFYSELGNVARPPPSDWSYNALNNQAGNIRDFNVSNCSYEGFVFRGPGDILIDNVTAELCFYPDEMYYGTEMPSLMFPTENITGMVWADKTSNNAVAGCELGFIHSHTHKNGCGIRLQGDVFLRIRSDNLTSEGCLGGIKVRGHVLGQLNKVNIRNQNIGNGSLPDFDFQTTDILYVAEYENRAAQGNKGSVRLLASSTNLQFGTLTFHGGTAGHGIVFESTVRHSIINQVFIHDFRGIAPDGNPSRAIWTKRGSTNIYIGCALIVNNSVGWHNDSTGDLVIKSGKIEGNTVAYPGIIPLDFASSPSLPSLKQCGFSINDGKSTKFATFNGSASIDPGNIVTEQTLTWTHNMWRTPTISEVTWNYMTNGTKRPTLKYMEITGTNATSITGRMFFSTAGNGTSEGSACTVAVS